MWYTINIVAKIFAQIDNNLRNIVTGEFANPILFLGFRKLNRRVKLIKLKCSRKIGTFANIGSPRLNHVRNKNDNIHKNEVEQIR